MTWARKLSLLAATLVAAGIIVTTAAASSSTNLKSPSFRAWNKGGAVQIPVPAAGSGKGVKIGFLGFGQNNPWSEWMFAGLKQEAQAFGATATFIGPPSFDPHIEAQETCDAATSKTYKILIIAPADSPSIVPCAKQAIAAGIKVIAVGWPIGPSVTSTKIQTPGVTSQILENVLEDARVMAQGVVTSCNGVASCDVEILWGVRTLAFDAVKPAVVYAILKQHQNIHIACESDAAYTDALGRSQAADCLQAHPTLHVIASQSDESIRGAEPSVTAAGKTFGLGANQIHLIGSYGSIYAIKQVRKGKWFQTFYDRPQSMVRAGVDFGLLSLQGKKVPSYVNQASLDNVGNVLNASVLKRFPGLNGQWDG
jgi:ribose transport system substrate-binding protein